MTHGIIFTGNSAMTRIARPAGAFRMRTWLEKHGYDIEVIDYFLHFSDDEIKSICYNKITEKTLFVGISVTFIFKKEKINSLISFIKEKFKHVKVIIGGAEGDQSDLDSKNVDKFIWGYSEQAMTHYLDFLSNKRTDDLNWTEYNGTMAIDAEKFYKNDDTDLTIEWKEDDVVSVNYLPIEISRGCIFRCRFCSFPLLGKKKNDYIRNEDNLADEIKRNWELWGVNNYSFGDDTFNDNMIKLEYVANAIAKSNVKITYTAFLRADLLSKYNEMIPILAETGLISGHFGIETFHETAKKAIGKGMDIEKELEAVRKLKKTKPLYTNTGMIVGLPGETLDSLEKTQEWFINQNGEVFNGWQWYPLYLRRNAMTRLSQFEKEYEKWGYSIKNEDYHLIINWQNKIMDFGTANLIASQLNKELEKVRFSRSRYYSTLAKYGKLSKEELKNFWWSFTPAELVALGLKIEDILYENFEEDFIEKILEKKQESDNNFIRYKNIKLTNIPKE